MVVGVLAQQWPVSVAGLLACCLIGIVANCVAQWSFDQRLLRREGQILEFLERKNKELEGKGMKWSVGKYGAYLILSFNESHKLLSGKRRAGPQLKQPRVVLNTEVDVQLVQTNRPAEMGV